MRLCDYYAMISQPVTYYIAKQRNVCRDKARVSRLGGLEPRAWRAREREPITGVWGQSPQRGPGAEPLVGGQGSEAPLKLKTF